MRPGETPPPPRRTGSIKPSTFRQALTETGVAQLREVLDAASRLILLDGTFSMDQIHDFGSAHSALDLLWAKTTSALRGDDNAAETLVTTNEVVDLLTSIRDAGIRLRLAESEHQRERAASVRDALRRLDSANSISEVLTELPKAMTILGFDRSIVSRVDALQWVPVAVGVPGDPDWANEILKAGQDHPRLIEPQLIEAEIMRRRAAIVVPDVAHQSEKVHTELVATTGTRSYVAAPLVADSSVVGFLHADRYFHRGEVDEADREFLEVFTRGANLVLQRVAIAEHIASLRAALRGLSEGTSPGVDWFGDRAAPGALDRASASATSTLEAHVVAPRRAPSLASELTRRETDVLRLMAAGETNRGIAARLVVSEATVKSHVGSILRKLQAANRAEAVARWVGSTR